MNDNSTIPIGIPAGAADDPQADLYQTLAKNDCTWDLILNDRQEVLYCSPTSKQINGYPLAHFLQNIGQIATIVHPQDKDGDTLQCDHDSDENGWQTGPYRIITPAGEIKWVVVFSRPIQCCRDSSVATLVSICDVTSGLAPNGRSTKETEMLSKRHQAITRQLANAYSELDQIESERIEHNRILEETKRELSEANNALKLLARNLDHIKGQTEEALLNAIYLTIYPLLEELEAARSMRLVSKATANLYLRLSELCSAIGKPGGANFRRYLSATEFKIAVLITEGLSSKQIATQLNVSLATIKTHRKNIRRKLKIQRSRINLYSYLKSNWRHRRAPLPG